MEDIILPSPAPRRIEEKSLKLRPLEQLEKITEKNPEMQRKIKMEFFEIQGPTKENQIGDLIYPLIELGITKAKVYATKVSDEAIRQVLVITPIVTQTIWDKLKAYLWWFRRDESKDIDLEKYTISEDDECVVIQAMEKELKTREIPDNYEVISNSMLQSSYIIYNEQDLKPVNKLQNMGENNQSGSLPMDLCESFILAADDGKYKNSFQFSDPGSIVYAPEANSSSFRAINCLAAEFELVGNKIIVNELASIPEEYLTEIEKQMEPPSTS